MGRPRLYPTDAAKQAAYRQRKAGARLDQIPVVHGEGYTVYQGDAVQVVPLLTGYDHCLTDPPYEAQAHTAMCRTRAVLEGREGEAALPFAPITPAQRRLLTRLRCQWILIFCQAEAIGRYQTLLGAKYRRALVWVKPDSAPQFTGDRPAMGHESLVCAWGQPGRSQWQAGGKRGLYTHLIRDGEERVHPTQKPVPLFAELVRDFTQPGDGILDPFMGSATCGVACLQEGRRFVGIERDPATFLDACTRLAQAARQGRLFLGRGPRPTQAPLFPADPVAPLPPHN